MILVVKGKFLKKKKKEKMILSGVAIRWILARNRENVCISMDILIAYWNVAGNTAYEDSVHVLWTEYNKYETHVQNTNAQIILT